VCWCWRVQRYNLLTALISYCSNAASTLWYLRQSRRASLWSWMIALSWAAVAPALAFGMVGVGPGLIDTMNG
jgi:hypothetical protein